MSGINRQGHQPSFDIVRTSHVEFIVTDLERSRQFYVDTLGFVETKSDSTTSPSKKKERIYLRGVEDRFHHSLVLTAGDSPAVAHIAYRVRSEEDLDLVAALFEKDLHLPTKWLTRGEDEEGMGRALRAQDPYGFPLEFFHEMDQEEWLLRRFDRHRSSRVLRIDHVNILVPEVDSIAKLYTEQLGFFCSEFTETEDEPPKLWATWLKRKPTVHDIAIMTGVGPRLHHAGFYVSEKDNILDSADILASRGYVENMERGPGRHGISNAFFLYVRDPDGHRIELYTGDYLSTDPGWEPLKWKLNDPQRQTFWGAPAPERWFSEASTVLSVFSGAPVPTSKPLHDSRRKNAGADLAH